MHGSEEVFILSLKLRSVKQAVVNIAKLKAWKELVDTNMQVYLIVILYVLLAESQLLHIIPFERTLIIITSLALYVTYTFLWNDYCDMPFDIKAGKKRIIHTMNKSLIIALILFLFISNVLVISLFANNSFFVLVYASAYFFATFYSAFPLRFKDRGIWGVLVDVLCEKSLPIVLVFLFFDYLTIDALFCLCLFSVFQLKIIFDHQLADYNNDLVSEVNTYAVRVGAEKVRSLLNLFIRPLVTVLFIIFYVILNFKVQYSIMFAGLLLAAYLMLKILISKTSLTE